MASPDEGTPIRYILLDIEGTTTPISFVADELFPYIRSALQGFLEKNLTNCEVQKFINDLRNLAEQDIEKGAAGTKRILPADAPKEELIASITANVFQQMDADRKSTELKALQGYMWRDGYAAAELVGKVFDDVPLALRRWQHLGTPVGIYSSGSIEAQKLLFGHTSYGSLLGNLQYHFDTTTGPKLEAESYRKIAAALKTKPGDILFVSDAYGEVVAAREAGCVTRIAVRPGNKSLPDGASEFVSVKSFTELFDDKKLLFGKPSP